MSLHEITPAELSCGQTLEEIYQSPATHYWTDNWSPEFYRALAAVGFISVSLEISDPPLGQILLPEMQSAYAVLDWENLHLSRSTRRWMRSDGFQELGLEFRTDCHPDEIIEGIDTSFGPDNWLFGRYRELLCELYDKGECDNFEVLCFGVRDREHRLIGGEVGYRIGRVYTSLTGFFERGDRRYSNVGKYRLYHLARHLSDSGFAFWNLGHPYMSYKTDLGAVILPRSEFLERWKESTQERES